MKITILGATGFVGKQLLAMAIAQGYDITVLVRDARKVNVLSGQVKVVVGDYFDAKALAEAIEGSAAVLSTIGPPTGRSTQVSARTYGEAMGKLVVMMEKGGVKRLIYLASTGTGLPGEVIDMKRKALRYSLALVAPLVIPAKEQEVGVLVESNLDWTAIRPPLITDKVAGRLSADGFSTQGWQVNTSQLVQFMLEQLHSERWVQAAPFVGTR